MRNSSSEPHGGAGKGYFRRAKRIPGSKRSIQIVCEEVSRLHVRWPPGRVLAPVGLDVFSDKEFYFGDQEEMGLGFPRRDAAARRAAKRTRQRMPPATARFSIPKVARTREQIWGNSAEWCDYSGTIGGQRVGMTIFCHPENFRPSWFHARDYGLLEANPFGRQAFGKGEKSISRGQARAKSCACDTAS